MIKDTHNKKNGSYKSIMAFVFLSILIFGLFLTFPVKTAQAQSWDLYYDVVGFYGDVADNSAVMSIYVKTSFNIRYQRLTEQAFCYPYISARVAGALFNIFDAGVNKWAVIDPFSIKENGVNMYYGTSFCWDAIAYYAQFTAGKTYEFKFTQNKSTLFPALLGVWSRTLYAGYAKGWFYLTIGDAVSDLFYNWPAHPVLYNPNDYLYLPRPTINITYPLPNAQIAEAFNIIGDYNVHSLDQHNTLIAEVKAVDTGTIYFFQQDLETPAGAIDLRVSGIPADSYELGFIFYFEGFGGAPLFFSPLSIPISIVNDISPELPITQEIPPDIYSPLSAQTIYTAYSNYATSTALFNSIAGAIEPLITTLGNNLTFFSSQFSQTNAKDTGKQAGNSVLLVRGYVENINTFFNDLPVSQVLFLYLMALVVVVIFRLIRLLIKLIPFI